MKMEKILGQYIHDYNDIILEKEYNNNKVFIAFNAITKRVCTLKVINKKQSNLGDNFLQAQIKREEEITSLCKSEYTVNLYRKLETEDYIIFEFENFETTALDYLYENGPLKRKLDFFKYLVQQLAYAIKVLHQKGIMHRNINPQNIFLNTEDEKKEIKLGDFSCSVHIKDNKSEQVGNFLFSSPEIIGGLEYNENCDLWSLGATLFFLYFGHLPYSENLSINTIKNIVLDDNNNFMIKKTNIPNLDILFKRLLVINPDYRMTYEEFFDYVLSEDFMKKDIICVNNNQIYKKLYDDILKEPKGIKEKEFYGDCITYESCITEMTEEFKNIISFALELWPDIMNIPDELEDKYNNIIYYDENIDFNHSINKDSDYFERQTQGAFIFCTNLESLKFVRAEILNENEKDERITFNLITTGSACIKIMEFLKEDKKFENCIQNVCIYCYKFEKYIPLKKKYSKIFDVCMKRNQVSEFIKKFSSEKIKPFPLTKLITYKNYVDKYKSKHFKLSTYYGHIDSEAYRKYISQMNLIEESKNFKNNSYTNKVFRGFLSFNIKNDFESLNSLIWNIYIRDNYFAVYNNWNRNMNYMIEYYYPFVYFISRLMYYSNYIVGKEEIAYIKENRNFYRGVKIPYVSILPYIRAKEKVIIISSFMAASEEKSIAEKYAGRGKSYIIYKTNLYFSVIFYIKNIYKNGWIPSGISIPYNSENYIEKEKDYLNIFLPFTFYYVRDVVINIQKFTADIYLETIGKTEILEEEIKMGKKVEYYIKENIVQIIKQ